LIAESVEKMDSLSEVTVVPMVDSNFIKPLSLEYKQVGMPYLL